MKIVPISLKDANEFVAKHHRHNKPTQGHKFSIGLEQDGQLVGVAIAGRPSKFRNDFAQGKRGGGGPPGFPVSLGEKRYNEGQSPAMTRESPKTSAADELSRLSGRPPLGNVGTHLEPKEPSSAHSSRSHREATR